MITFTSYIEFFRNLTEKHIDMAPTGSKKTFFRLNIEEITGAMRSTIDADKHVMALESYEHTSKDLHSDNHLRDYTGAFIILKRVAKLDDFDAQDDAIDECEQIAIETSKRVYADSLDYDNRTFLNIELSDFTFQKVGPLYNNWFGFRCQFNFTDTYSIEVDNSQWSDLP